MNVYCEMDSEMLERFSMGKASVEETEEFEEHLLLCDACRMRFEESDSYVAAIRSASAQLERERADMRAWWTLPRLVPVLAGVALLMAAIVTVAQSPPNVSPSMATVLTATRSSAAGATARAGRAMRLTVDVSGLSSPSAYRLELVNERGRITWQGAYDPGDGPVAVPAQAGGPYFLRVYSAGGTLLREYGLRVER
jgi:hypothetical protein